LYVNKLEGFIAKAD